MKTSSAIWKAIRQELTNFGRWDWSAITLSFIAATLIWLFNALNKTYTTTIVVPVEFLVKVPRVVSLEPLPKTLELYITGTGWGLIKTLFRDKIPPIAFEIKNPLQTPYLLTRRLIPQIAESLPSAKIERCEQDTLYFHFEPIQEYELTLPIGYEYIPLAEGHRFLYPPKVNPKRIKIYGPPSMLKQAAKLIRYEFPDKLSGNFNQVVRIYFPANSFITPSLEQVHVSFQTAYFVHKERQVSIELKDFPSDSSVVVQPSTAKIIYYTLPENQTATDTAAIRLWLYWRKIRWKDSTLLPDLITTEDFFEPQIVPPVFKVVYAKGRNYRRNRQR
ncbi:MAG: hypothetical protein RMJ44_01200 [Cytophagales bacterium]|nr:hypothetical protein [Bernardetiaceae bacterium]MDW8209676.1 hypothetical protein [Cytophagales bacterium]